MRFWKVWAFQGNGAIRRFIPAEWPGLIERDFLSCCYVFFECLLSLVVFIGVAVWFNTITPPADSAYPKHLKMPSVTIDKNNVVMKNVRNSYYRTAMDFDAHYETRYYDLSKIRTLDIFVHSWGKKMVADTFLTVFKLSKQMNYIIIGNEFLFGGVIFEILCKVIHYLFIFINVYILHPLFQGVFA